jgi:hypothetical protein
MPAAGKKCLGFQKEITLMRQYEILNRCLKELYGSQLHTDKRLRIEVLLNQIKLALLKVEVESRVSGDAASEQEFLGVYDRVRRVCGFYREVETDFLIGHLERMKKSLNGDPEAQPAIVRPEQKKKARHLWSFLRTL